MTARLLDRSLKRKRRRQAHCLPPSSTVFNKATSTMYRLFFAFVIASTTTFCAANTVSAQELPAPKSARTVAPAQEASPPVARPETQADRNQQVFDNLSPEMKDRIMKKGVRLTVGAQTTAGWEKTLTTGNRNLGHFYWSPMTNYIQAGPTRRTGTQTIKAEPPRRRDFRYIKPVREALPANPIALSPPQDVKPYRAVARHLPPPRNTQIRENVSGKLTVRTRPTTVARHRHAEHVNGTLLSKQTDAALCAQYPETKTQTFGDLTSHDVHGTLVGK